MKKKVWLWVLGIAVVAIIGVVVYLVMNKNTGDFMGDEMEEWPMEVQKAKMQKLGESVLVTGKIIPEDEQKVFIDLENGEIKQYLVEENQKVVAGEPLFTYDTATIDAEYNKAVRSRDLVQKQLNLEKNEIDALAKQIAEMKKNVNTSEEYTMDDVRMLEKEKVQSEMSIEGTKDELTSSQEAINELTKKKKEMTVVSKIDGTVVKVNKNVEPTESGANTPIVHIISSEPFKVIGTMSEFDTVKIKPEQAVIIRPKVFKDREWNGVVESVSEFPEGDDGGGMDDYYDGGGGGNVTMYPFKVAMTDDTSELRQGFHVSMEIDISGGGEVLVVPHMALAYDEETGEEYVFALVDGLLEKRFITIGEMDDEYVEITEGVNEGELIVIMPTEDLVDGMEVTSYDEVDEY